MLYVKQVSPEYQESPLYLCDCFPDDLAVYGNRQYKEHKPEVFARVVEALNAGELAEALEDVKTGDYYSGFYKNATDAVNDLLPPEKAKYSTRDIHAIKTLAAQYVTAGSGDADIICAVLGIVTGEEWDYMSITGICQGDWNRVYYPVSRWSREALKAFEVEYFNTGSEWIIHDEDEEPESPGDIKGYSVYCTSWSVEGIKKELAAVTGEKPEDIELYEFDGYTRTPNYKRWCG